jgi:hypothetical protein
MWFWLHHGQSFDNVWSIEYDVRWCGPLSFLWTYELSCDFIYSDLLPMRAFGNNHYWSGSITKKWAIAPTKTACKQVFRCSSKFLRYLHDKFQKEMNAQDEIALCSHAHQGNFRSATLTPVMSKTWTTSPGSSPIVEKLWLSKYGSAQFELFHPVK